MLKFLSQRSHSHQHIIPLHAKYVVIWAIIIFAAASSHIPTFLTPHTNSNYRSESVISFPKKAEALTINYTPIKKKTSVRIVQRSEGASITIHGNTPSPDQQKNNQPAVEESSKNHATNTPTPTPIKPEPTRTPTPEVKNNPNPSDARQQLLLALNSYRQKKGKAALVWDDTLGAFAQGRAETFDHNGKMDDHAGFRAMLNNNGFAQMGFNALAENSSYGDTRDPIYIIETMYGQSPGHDANQLNSEYTHVGVGASGKATDFVFGGRKK